MKAFTIFLALFMTFLVACTPSEQYNSSQQIEKGAATHTICTGTVQSTYVKPPHETGFACTAQECATSHPVGSLIDYPCNANNKCPVSVSGASDRANCTDSTGQSYLRACGVRFSHVTNCH
jgi:hypothetical protein